MTSMDTGTGAVDARLVTDVRQFNRFYTSIMGFLDQGLLQSNFTLTEARVVFELAQQEQLDVAALRARMKIDGGHLSRILARFESASIAQRDRSVVDGRRQVVALTSKGRSAFDDLNARSDVQARRLLASLSGGDQRRLVSALQEVQTLLTDGASPKGDQTLVIRPIRAGDLGWVVQRHGGLYAREYGWDQTFEALVAKIVAQYGGAADATSERAWIAELNSEPVGSVFCMRKSADTAQLRLLLVEPSARGTGVGSRLVDECLTFARDAGYSSITLWTNDVLTAARRIYERAGFELREEDPHHSFGHDLVGQYWAKNLT